MPGAVRQVLRRAEFHDSLYRDLIRRYLQPGTDLLDAGCGRYLRFCREFAPDAHVVGIDLEETFECDNSAPPFAVRGDIGQPAVSRPRASTW